MTVSLDSLDEAVFARMSGGFGGVAEVLDGIEHARRAELTPIKVNAVIQRGINDHTALDLLEHFRGSGVIVRFIEYMDVGNRNHWRSDLVVPSSELAARIGARWPLTALKAAYRGEVAERYAFADGAGEVGFISSVSQPFCGDCSRARLSSDGVLYTCLFATQGASLRDALRGGASDDALAGAHPRHLDAARRPLQRAARQPHARGARGAQGRNVLHRWLMARARLTHLDAANRPTMVDVGAKEVTLRTAVARSAPAAAARGVGGAARQRPPHQEGTGVRHRHHRRRHGRQAHPRADPVLPSARARAAARSRSSTARRTRSWCAAGVSVHHRTGVEMEALTGASVAALTLYDMCKALSHD